MKTFSQRVIELARSIPKGRVTTYGRLASAAGAGPMAAQSITAILSKSEGIPFHRIVYSDGRIWINNKHKKERMKLYEKEGIEIENGKVKHFRDILLEFK